MTTRAISLCRTTTTSRSLNSRRMGRKAPSLATSALVPWSLTRRAIFLCRTAAATRSSNSRPIERRAPLPRGSALWSWLLTVRVIFLPRIITATQSSNSLRMESKAPSPRILPLTVCTTLPLTQRTISSSWIVAAKPSSNSRLMERRQRLLLATLQGRPLIKRTIFMFGKAGRS